MANKKDEQSPQEQVNSSPIKYIHLNEFLSKRVEKLPKEIVDGFRIFLKGRLYQLSHEDFEEELKSFFKRKI